MINKKTFAIKIAIFCLLYFIATDFLLAKDIKLTKVSGIFGSQVFNPQMVTLNNGKVLIIRNSQVNNGCNIADIYDPKTNEVYAEATMSACRVGSAITKLVDGKILVSGGIDNSENISYADVYDPEKHKFFKTGNMLMPRVKHSATLLNDGRVLIIGGQSIKDNSESVNSCEFYNPKTNKFENIFNTGQYRSIKNLIPLPGNKILVIEDGSIELLDLNKEEFQHPFHLENFHDTSRTPEIYSYLKGDDLRKVMSRDYKFESYIVMPNGNVFLVDDDINLWLFKPINNSLENIDYPKNFKYFSANEVSTHLIGKNEVLILYTNCEKGIFRVTKINLFKKEIVDVGSLDDACLYYDSVSLPNGNVVIVASDPILSGNNIAMYDVEKDKLVPLGKTLHKRERFKAHLLENGKVFILGYFDSARNTGTPPSGEVLEIKQ